MGEPGVELTTMGVAHLLERLNRPCECERYPDREKEHECQQEELDRWWKGWR